MQPATEPRMLAALEPLALGGQRIAVRVTADAARQVRAGHPWVFDGSVTSAPEGAATGTLAVVFDPKRAFAGIGLWDPRSPIRVKVLHHGEPLPVDAAFWRTKLRSALARRAPLAGSTHTDAYRCVHGESDGFPGLVLDRYAGTYVLKLYSDAWWPHLLELIGTIEEVITPERLVLRAARNVTSQGIARNGAVLLGPPVDGPVRCREQDLLLDVDVVHGHKTGHFLDQRDNRLLVRSLSAGRRVLDVFCATGGFSLAAAAGGATSVHGVDVSAAALEAAQHHMELNAGLRSVRSCRHFTTLGDAFAVMAALAARQERFDLVVVDPPSFASRQSQVPGALHAYRRLAGLALPLVAPGGQLLQASCTSRVSVDALSEAVHASARRAGLPLTEARRTGQPIDHPVGFPESAYLKAILFDVAPRRSR